MQFNTFVAAIADLDACVQAPHLQEVLIEPLSLARQGKLLDAAAQDLAREAMQRQLRPVLVWDILMPERVMQRACDRLQAWDLSCFAAIRVCDPGAAYWLKTQFPQMPIQLIVETGNHNLEALQGWCTLIGDALERLILSIELPEETLIHYCQTLPVPCELLGVGQILLFYSPRSLLSDPLAAPTHAEDEPWALAATAAFEDAPHRQLPTLETLHGTFLFLDKDQFILDRLDALKAAGLHTVRLDLRHLSRGNQVSVGVDRLCQQILSDPVSLRQTWTRETRAPFFKANRTTALFPRLKSPRAHLRDEECLAEAIAGEGKKYVVFQALRPFDVRQIQTIRLPTGETLPLPPQLTFRTVDGQPLQQFAPEQIFVSDWIKKTVPGSLLLTH